MSLHTWLLYLITCLGISLTPGPNSLLALSHGAIHGRRKALCTISGGLLGFASVIALCLVGIGALLQASVFWLTLLKWGGGIYLVWLGFKLWRSPAMRLEPSALGTSARGVVLFKQGLFSSLTNPKAILFFTALLPQFVDPDRTLWLQVVLMVATYTFTEFTVEFGLACTAHRIRPWLARAGQGFNRSCGGMFVFMGLALPAKA